MAILQLTFTNWGLAATELVFEGMLPHNRTTGALPPVGDGHFALTVGARLDALRLRVLLSEQRLVHKVVVKNPDTNTFETQTAVVEGPTNLLTSTTRSLLDPEIESRMVDRWSDTSEPHMRAVLNIIGKRAAGGKEPDRQIEVWHTFARWVRRGPTDVMIPFAKLLADSWSVGAGSRTFRDLNNLISIIRERVTLPKAGRDRTTAAVRQKLKLEGWWSQ